MWLTLAEARKILQQHDFPLPRAIQVDNTFFNNPASYKDEIESTVGFPCVVKAISPDIIHKTDVGAVRLGVKTFTELVAVIRDMKDTLDMHYRVDGFLIEEQIQNIQLEMVIGVKKDQTFDHVIMVGLGGIHVEILEDVSFRLIPITREDAREMLDELRARKLLEATRGREPVNKDALVSLMMKVSNLVTAFPQIVELDLNPVGFVDAQCTVLDVRIKMENDDQVGNVVTLS